MTDDVVTLGLDRLVVDRLTAGVSPVHTDPEEKAAAGGSVALGSQGRAGSGARTSGGE